MSVHYVRGSDPTLRENALNALIGELLGGEDRSLAVEEHTVPGRTGDGEAPGGAEGRAQAVDGALNAAQSPPFMTERRVVVLRDAGNLAAADADVIVAYLEDPLETTELVLVAGGGRLPTNLTKAWKGAVHEVGPPSEVTSDVLADALKAAGVELDAEAQRHVVAHLGEDAGRVPQLVAVLDAAFTDGAVVSVDEVEPYLGDEGAVPAYQLTNMIEAGDVPGALEVLHRMVTAAGARDGRPMHPLQVLAMLHSHYRRLLRLDDPEIRGSADAVEALGGKVKEYPAKKALAQARALGTDRIRRAYQLLGQTDLDLKGARAIPEDVVLEVLVARLAQLSAQSGAGARRGRASARR